MRCYVARLRLTYAVRNLAVGCLFDFCIFLFARARAGSTGSARLLIIGSSCGAVEKFGISNSFGAPSQPRFAQVGANPYIWTLGFVVCPKFSITGKGFSVQTVVGCLF